MIIIASGPILIFACTLFKCTNNILVYWCITTLSTTFQLFRGGQFYWWRKLEYPVKTINLSQVIDKHYHIMLNRVYPAINGVRIPSVSGDMH
jgi:hypothetical protein